MVNPKLTGKGAFPDENVSSKVKESKDWLLQYARAVYHNLENLSDQTLGFRSRLRYREIRDYAIGNQDIEKYFEILTPNADDDQNGINGLSVSKKIIKYIPKLRAIAISLIQKANEGFDLVINPIDSQAALEMEEKARDVKAKVALRDALNKNGMGELAQTPAVMQLPGEPEDMQGAEVYIMGMRHEVAMKIELVIAQILSSNQYQDMREKIAADLFDFGAAVVRDQTNGCNIKLHKIDLRGFICSPFSSSDGKDELTYVGEIRELPVSQLLSEAEGQISDEDKKKIYEIGATWGVQGRAHSGVNGDWRTAWGRGRVQVVELEIRSTDSDYREERINKHGNLVFGKAKYGAKTPEDGSKKIYQKREQNIYTCKWVVNTDVLYDFGRQVNVKVDPHNETATAQFSYHIVTAMNNDMVCYSRTEALMYYADQIQLRRMSLEHRFNTAVPAGFAIDFSALEEIAMNAGGSNITPAEALQLYRTHGIVVWRSELLTDGQKAAGPPIVKLDDGIIGAAFAEYWNDIQQNIALGKETVGLNEVTDGNAPNPKRLNAGTEAAVTGTKNAMNDMFNADRRLLLSVSDGSTVRAQNLFKLGKGEEFINSLGSNTVMFLKGIPTIEPYRYGYTIEDRPSPEDIQAFQEELQKALMENQIDIADAAIIRSIKNIKQRNAYLIYAVRRKADKMQQQAMENSKQQAELQIQSAQEAEKAKQGTLQVQFKLEAELAKLKGEIELRNGTAIETIRLDGKRIDAVGRVDASRLQATARDVANIRDNQVKVSESENPDAAANIDLTTPADLTPGIQPQSTPEAPIVPGVEELSQQQFSFTAPPEDMQQDMNAGMEEGPMPGMEEEMPMGDDQGMPPEAAGMMPPTEEPMPEGAGPSEEDVMNMLQ